MRLLAWAASAGPKQKQDRITAKEPCPPQRFLYLRETKSWWCEGGGGGEGGRRGE